MYSGVRGPQGARPQAQHPSATEMRAPQDLGRSVGLLTTGPSAPLQPLAVQQCTWNPHDALLLYVLCASMGGTLLLSTMSGYDDSTSPLDTNNVLSAVASSCALGFLVLLGSTVRAAPVAEVKGFSGTPCGGIAAVLIPGTFTAVLVWAMGVLLRLSEADDMATATQLIGAGTICLTALSAVSLMVLGQALIRGKQAHTAATLLFLFAVLLFESLSITGSAASALTSVLSVQVTGGAVAMCAVTLMMVLPPIRTHASVLFVVGVVVAEAGRIAQTKRTGVHIFTGAAAAQGYIHVINTLAVVVVALSRRDEQGCHSSNHSDGAPLLPAQPAGYGTGTAVPHPTQHTGAQEFETHPKVAISSAYVAIIVWMLGSLIAQAKVEGQPEVWQSNCVIIGASVVIAALLLNLAALLPCAPTRSRPLTYVATLVALSGLIVWSCGTISFVKLFPGTVYLTKFDSDLRSYAFDRMYVAAGQVAGVSLMVIGASIGHIGVMHSWRGSLLVATACWLVGVVLYYVLAILMGLDGMSTLDPHNSYDNVDYRTGVMIRTASSVFAGLAFVQLLVLFARTRFNALRFPHSTVLAMMFAAGITVTLGRVYRTDHRVVRISTRSSIVSHCIADVLFPAASVLLYRAVPLTPSLLHPGPQAQHPSATDMRMLQHLYRIVGLLTTGPSVPLQPLAVQQCTWNPHDALLLYVLCASMGGTLLLSTMVGYDDSNPPWNAKNTEYGALFFDTNNVTSAVASSCALGFLVLLGGTVRAASVSKVKGFSGTPCGGYRSRADPRHLHRSAGVACGRGVATVETFSDDRHKTHGCGCYLPDRAVCGCLDSPGTGTHQGQAGAHRRDAALPLCGAAVRESLHHRQRCSPSQGQDCFRSAS